MPDYKQGKIYTVRCKTDDTLIYVGCTTEMLSRRMAKHKYQSKINPNICFYQHVNNWNDWYIELYEDYPCENTEQLNKREGEIIREIGTVNKSIAGRTRQEWYEDNKEKYKEYNKKYHQNNKDKRKETDQEYKQKNKDKICEYQKEYKQKNKDKICKYQKEYNKKYYETKKTQTI